VRQRTSQDVSIIQHVLITLVLCLTMKDSNSFDSVNRMFEFVLVAWVHFGYIANCRSQYVIQKTRSYT